MSIPRFFARQPVLVNLLMLAIIVAGVFALNRMPLENHPSIDLDMAVIVVNYLGASPDEVEKLITLPIEDQISSLPDIDYISAISSEGRASFIIKYEPELEDFDQSVADLKAEVDKVENDLPEEARDNIYVIKIATDEIWPVGGISLGGDYSIDGLNKLAESLKDEFLDIKDVSSVEIHGTLKREIWIEADRSRLNASHVSLSELAIAIQMANINLPSGRVTLGREEFLVRSMGEVSSPEEIGKIIVRADLSGSAIRVKDVAYVNDTFQKDEVVSRINGKPSVHVRVFMKRDGSVVDVMDDVREVIKRYQENIPDVAIIVRHDASIEVKDSISVLSINALTGLVLVAFLMTLIIGVRSAIFAIIGIPFAFLAAFIFLDATGGSINTLSLFAFILVLGMIVDDAIIIIENVYRHMEGGKSPVKAAIEGAEEVMWPVISAILTTIAAFLPLLMMAGVIGKFLSVLPIVVTLALLGSLTESLVILPSHLADFGRIEKNRLHDFGDRLYHKLLNIYKKQLDIFLNHRYLVALGILVITVAATATCAKTLRIEMFPEEGRSSETLIVRMPVGTKLAETNRVLTVVEKRLADIPKTDLKSISTLAGFIIDNERWIRSTEGGMISLELGDKDKRRTNDEIKDDVRARIADIPEIHEVYFGKGQGGPPTGSPVELRVRGNDLERMQYLSGLIMDDLKAIKGVSDIQMSHRQGKKELRFIPDRVKMSAYGLSMTLLATTMRTAVEGLEATKFRDEDGDEVKVLVMYREEDRDEVGDLKNMIIDTPLGISVPLSELGEFAVQRGASSISRRDGKRTITITADVNRIDVNSDEANSIIKEKYADFSTRFPGYNLDFGGEAQEQAESFSSLMQAFIVALILIYLILGTQFQSFIQPIVVMYTVPFSMLGVAVGLLVSSLTFSLVAGISVVALSGVVVNDSLILVDFINKARASGMPLREALIVSGSRRMRPIIITTITTIAGLLPMATGLGGTSETWQPMAICICWGLAFATFLTLFVIPCAYYIVDSWTNRLRKIAGLKTTDEILVGRNRELLDDTVL